MVTKLTSKQLGFVDSIVNDRMSQAAAYRANYDVENMATPSIQMEATRLAAHPRIALLIASKREAIEAVGLWSRQEAFTETLTNLSLARASNQLGPANVAVKLGMELAGLNQPTTSPGNVAVTTIVINKSYHDGLGEPDSLIVDVESELVVEVVEDVEMDV